MAISRQDRMKAGALAYAQADKSDPFAYSRAMTHVRNGVASIEGDKDAFYDAERTIETRTLSSGESFNVEAFKNAKRP